MDPSRSTARLAGLLYLVIIVCAGFAEGVVRSEVVVPGDAAATAARILESALLYRMGLLADLVAFVCDAAVAVLLYRLLRPVSRTVSLVAAAFRLVAHPGIAAVNLLNHWAALRILGGGGLEAVFEPAQREALAMLALEAHGIGYLLAGAFFGVHCALLGWLLFRAGYFPRVLGVLLLLAGAGYLIETFGTLAAPGYGDVLVWFVAVPAAVGELSLALYLLVKGIRTQGDSGGGRQGIPEAAVLEPAGSPRPGRP